MKRLAALTVAAVALCGCELQPGQPAEITVTEAEAWWVDVTPPTKLNAWMDTAGDMRARCEQNFAGHLEARTRYLDRSTGDEVVGWLCVGVTLP